jgi:probable rRNA maturation factor
MTATLDIDVTVGAAGWRALLGEEPRAFARRVLSVAAAEEAARGAVAVLFGDDAAVRALNRTFRSKDSPTNVLSFAAPAHFGTLGDIALALETVTREAEEQGKTAKAHATHLLAHGYLHLAGYDHDNDEDAEKMEARERAVLARLGLPDPYAERAP